MIAGGVNHRWRALKTFGWALVALLTATLLDRGTFFHHKFIGPIAQFDPIVSDFVAYHLFTPPRPTGAVVIAEIDDRSIRALGRFPWSRSVEARLVDVLTAADAKVIAFDMFFSERDPGDLARVAIADRLRSAGIGDVQIARAIGASGDNEFARSIRAAGRVFIAYSFNRHLGGTRRDNDSSASQAALLDPPPVAFNLVRKLPGSSHTPAVANAYLAPIPILNRAARGAAYVDIDEDEDGKARSYPAVVLFDGRYCAPLFLAAAQAYLDNPALILNLGPSGVTGIELGTRQIPVDELGRMMIHYRGQTGTIPRYAVVDILEHRVPVSAFSGKIVMVGVTAHALGDRFVTPLGGDFPGVELQATAADNVLGDRFIHQSFAEKGEERWAGWILGGIVGIAAAFMTATQSLLIVVLMALGYFSYTAWRFHVSGAVLGIFFPLFAMFLAYLATISYRYRTEGREKRYLRSAFEMYLHPAVIASVVDDPDGLKLGGQRHHLSVLFADIVGFTERAERLAPEPLVAMLNTYMSIMTEVILRSGGVVDKLMGDGIMAFWGPPLKMAAPARAAVECALNMLDELGKLAERDARFVDLEIGIGISTGDAIVGNLGGARHFDYSAVGDTVNLASRLEGLTRRFKVRLLANRQTLDEAGSGYISREVGLVRVKGRDQPTPVVEIVARANDGVNPAYYQRFVEALTALRRGNTDQRKFQALLTERPDDEIVSMYLKQLNRNAHGHPGEVVFDFDNK
jgi:adenylate cyclase